MRSSTISRFRRFTLLGVALAPGFWLVKWALQLLHVLRESAVPPTTFADRVLSVLYWDIAGFFLLAVMLCSLILLYVIACPPPRDIDQ